MSGAMAAPRAAKTCRAAEPQARVRLSRALATPGRAQRCLCLAPRGGLGAGRRSPLAGLGPALRRGSRGSAIARASLDPDNSSILVAGGGGVALHVTRKLKDMGAWVWMLQRTENLREEIEGMMAIVAPGDALNQDDISRVFDEIDDLDAVVSTIGGTPADPMADSVGNINLIEAAAAKGVKRFILVTSIGTGDSKDAPPAQVYDVLKPVLIEKGKAEQRLRDLSGDMEFVIVRPGGLKSEPATTTGVLTLDTTICGAIHREDVAQLVCQCLFSDKCANKTFSAVDKEQMPAEASQFETFSI